MCQGHAVETNQIYVRLQSAVWDVRGDDIANHYFVHVGRVRAIEVNCGPKQTQILLYYGLLCFLEWDLASFTWPKSCDFMKYSSNVGWKMLWIKLASHQLSKRNGKVYCHALSSSAWVTNGIWSKCTKRQV